jgi:hypothetical protein
MMFYLLMLDLLLAIVLAVACGLVLCVAVAYVRVADAPRDSREILRAKWMTVLWEDRP